jgi:hypothetical protein
MPSEALTVPEVARRLGIPGPDVYELIFSGELEGRPRHDGAVYVTEAAVAEFEARRRSSRASR